MKKYDVIIIGAGAAGLMCAIEAGKRGRRVLVLDHANKVGKKILMSGGGRCNFTNYHIEPDCYQSHNPHFVKSALSRYTQWDFIKLVEKHNVPYYEKTLGQLFCVNKSIDIVNILLKECEDASVDIKLKVSVESIKHQDNQYHLATTIGMLHCEALVIATGGLSIPTMGATPFAYKIAEQFGLHVWPTRAGLVPFTLNPEQKTRFLPLVGSSTMCTVNTAGTAFKEAILFTHRGLSGPSMLQISSYWDLKQEIEINLLPEHDLLDELQHARDNTPKKQISSVLHQYLPKRMIEVFIPEKLRIMKLADCSNQTLESIVNALQYWRIKPNGTEGYRTAEVTMGGVDCHALSSKTMEVNTISGLYFIGEALDVTGWLGGYNFQWAWSSGFAAGQVV